MAANPSPPAPPPAPPIDFRSLVEHASDVIYVAEPDGTIRYATPSAAAMFGRPLDEVVGRSILLHVHPDDALVAAATLRAAGTCDGVHETEARVRHADGRWLVTEVRGRCTRLAGDDDHCLIVTVRDVTEQRRAEAELRESERRYRELLQQASDGVAVVDVEGGRVVEVNRALCEMLGYRREELLALPLDDLLVGDGAGRAERLGALREGATLIAERQLRRRDGTPVAVEISTRSTGTLVSAIVRDITERKALEEQLRQAQKMEAVGQLAGGIAHDFNNLLTVMRTHAELLAETLPDDVAAREDVEEIRRAAERAAALTRQLLAFSRKQLLRPELLDARRVVRDMEPMLRRLIGEDVRLVTRLPEAPAVVRADPGQLEQVLLNLAVNARDAMPHGGTVTIEVAPEHPAAPIAHEHGVIRPAPYVALRVRDTGTGMSDAVRARIFEPFFTTKPAGKGTGLGLSTVYGIVRQSDGHIVVTSAPGAGSTFAVYLPRVEAAAPGGAPPGAAPEPARGSETVLLVEDEAPVRALARRVLAAQGYTVLEARDGEEALRLADAHQGRIDLVLTDVVMPRMGGRDLAQALVAARPGVRIVYMSGHTDDVILHRGALNPRMVFLQKPFSARELAVAVRRALDVGRARGAGEGERRVER